MSGEQVVQLRVKYANFYSAEVLWIAEVALNFQSKDLGNIETELGNVFLGDMGAVLVAPLSADTRIVQVEVWPWQPDDFEPVITIPDPVLSGSIEEQVCPHQVAALMRWTTAVGGRAGTGRSYLYGFPITSTVFGNFWTEAALTAMSDIGDQMLFSYGPSGSSDLAQFVVISNRLHGAPRDERLVSPVTGFEAVELIATQRRRLYLLSE